jgi:hypothetical protein
MNETLILRTNKNTSKICNFMKWEINNGLLKYIRNLLKYNKLKVNETKRPATCKTKEICDLLQTALKPDVSDYSIAVLL